ncbi:hypothetical protein FMZ60_07075 [Alcaligenaceae bacterium SJ-26]|nr:hypothetical protein FMZ60_07075 [Alcaligenaceae bacterium SJ-26]
MKADELSAKIRSPGFLARIFDSSMDWDQALDGRDACKFDQAWCASHEAVQAASRNGDSSEICRLRESVFKQVLSLTGNPDVAAYASDDFGLMAQAAEAGVQSPFINGLWNAYLDGRFPGGSIT